MKLDIRIRNSERIEARFDGLTVSTAQDGSAPAPFDLFLAALGTCAGYYLAQFCHSRGIATGGIHISQTVHRQAATCLADRIELEITLPADFPQRYRSAAMRAVEQCTVKKQLAAPPVIETRLSDQPVTG